MRKMLMPATCTALMALGLATSGALGSGGTSAGPSRIATIHVIATGASAHLVDAPPAATSPEDLSPGDALVFSDVLTRNGHRVGTDSGVCTLVARSKAQCQITAELPGGRIVSAGGFDFSEAHPNALAIIGGTGAHRRARGTLRIKHLSSTPVDADDELFRVIG